MKKPASFLDTPSHLDFIGLPKGNYWIHEFPEDMASAQNLTLTLNGVEKEPLNFSGTNLKPDKRPKVRSKLNRHTEIALSFRYKFKAMKVFLDTQSRIAFVLGKRDTPIAVKPEIFVPVEAHIITYYEKRRKRKILNACYFGPGHPVTDIHRALASYDAVVAVDTNTKDVPGRGKVAATTAIEASMNIVTEDAGHFQSGNMRQKITIDPPGNPEIYGIGFMLRHFFDANPQLIKGQIAVITDTELDLIKGMNQRKIPFFKERLLPNNTTLFFATSDSGSTEYFANKLIRMCDNESAKYLNSYLRDYHN